MEGWRQQATSSVKLTDSSDHYNRVDWRTITDEIRFSLTPAGLLMEGLIRSSIIGPWSESKQNGLIETHIPNQNSHWKLNCTCRALDVSIRPRYVSSP